MRTIRVGGGAALWPMLTSTAMAQQKTLQAPAESTTIHSYAAGNVAGNAIAWNGVGIPYVASIRLHNGKIRLTQVYPSS